MRADQPAEALSRECRRVIPSAGMTRTPTDWHATTKQGRVLDNDKVAAAMAWVDPARDVSLPRAIALRALDQGRTVRCVWTGERLQQASLDIDHCLPWAAWPCSDLWNLLPTHRRVNRHLKRDRLPSTEALQRARDAMLTWWDGYYLSGG